MKGVPDTYYEASFRGHKASPGKYSVTLKSGSQQANTSAEILENPLYATTMSNYREYDRVMQAMETEFSRMHTFVNTIAAKREQLTQLLANLPADARMKTLRTEGEALVQKMKTWDEDMVQRKSKAYDDVENFPNKFTAEYIFLINQTESDIPVVNKPSLDRKQELDAQWKVLQAKATEILEADIPALNKKLFESGVGGIWKQ
jgi:hypothetical protein